MSDIHRPDKRKRRLRNLRLNRVDIVTAGANSGALITLHKFDDVVIEKKIVQREGKYCVTSEDGSKDFGCYGSKEEAVKRLRQVEGFSKAATKTEDGQNYPSGDYAYVPDSEKPSTWKLRLTSSPGGSPDPRIVGAAIAALGKGFRGQKVQIPNEDLPKVKAKVKAAWKKAHPDKGDDDIPSVIKMEVAVMAHKVNKKDDGTIEVVLVKDDGTEEVLETIKSEVKDDVVSKADYDAMVALQKQQAEQLAKMERERKEAEFVAKAEQLPKIGTAAELGAILLAANEHFPKEQYETLEKILKAANAQAESAELFKQYSQTNSDEPVEFEVKLRKAAEEKVTAGKAKTIEEAEVLVMNENAELRAEYAKRWR